MEIKLLILAPIPRDSLQHRLSSDNGSASKISMLESRQQVAFGQDMGEGGEV
jgi:hypothetical protein